MSQLFEKISLEAIGGIVKNVLEIGIISFLIYSALLFLRGTRAAFILVGIAMTTMLLFFISWAVEFQVINWLLGEILRVIAIAVVIIFQPEIRRAFAEAGSQRARLRSHFNSKKDKENVEVLLNSVFYLAGMRIGALIAIERNIGMRAIADTGTSIMAGLNKELLTTFFFPNTPLHDGGVIIKGDKIIAAGCIFPLSQNPDFNKSLGMRHRAALGLSEETDALVLVVSEETGGVSLAHKGRMVRGMSRKRLQRHLTNYLVNKNPAVGPDELTADLDMQDSDIDIDKDTQNEAVTDA